jgi:hypothetical protein
MLVSKQGITFLLFCSEKLWRGSRPDDHLRYHYSSRHLVELDFFAFGICMKLISRSASHVNMFMAFIEMRIFIALLDGKL